MGFSLVNEILSRQRTTIYFSYKSIHFKFIPSGKAILIPGKYGCKKRMYYARPFWDTQSDFISNLSIFNFGFALFMQEITGIKT